MATLIKIGDVTLQDVTSEQSSSSSRLTINDNFHKLRATLVSVWEQLDSITNILTNSGLGSIDLHSDVSTTGVNTPTNGQVLGWDGTKWVPINMTTSGGLVNFLYELTDIEDFSYPQANRKILRYDPIDNIWKIVDYDIYSLTGVDFIDDGNFSILVKKTDGDIDAVAISGSGFLKSTGSGLALSTISLSDISDILTGTPALNQKYVLQWNGSAYAFSPESLGQGIKNHINLSDTIFVPVDYQYIVHQELILDGIIDVEGELVIL